MRIKISSKLIVAVGGVTIAVVGIFSYRMIHSQKEALIAQVEHHANQLSEMIKASTKYDMLQDERERIHRLIDTLGQQEGMERIRVFNKEGRVIYSSDKGESGQMVDKKAESCYACHAADEPLSRLSITERTRTFKDASGKKQLGIINPIYNERSCWEGGCHAHRPAQQVLGVLDVTMSLDAVDRQLAHQQGRVVLFTVVALLALSATLWFFVHQLVGRPVGRLVEATKKVAEGDLDYQIPVTRHDELGNLGQSFNQMTRRLTEAQRQIYQSEKLASLGRLAAGIAHEINNPLTGVLTYSSFLLKRCSEDSEMKEDLEVIVRETKRCREIVKGILDFARPVPVRRSPTSLNDLILQTLKLLENEFSLAGVQVEKELKEELPLVSLDGNQMQQVLINLLQNAADAVGDQNGKIRIVTGEEETGRFVVLKVADNGCGIPRENLATIFDPFFTTKGQKGTGLGLAVVWAIVERHGGKIEVTSEPGKGTLFTLRFPLEGSPPAIRGEREHGFRA